MALSRTVTETYLAILKEELVPAMGCTEPIAIAYAASILRDVLGEEPTEVQAVLSGNISNCGGHHCECTETEAAGSDGTFRGGSRTDSGVLHGGADLDRGIRLCRSL